MINFKEILENPNKVEDRIITVDGRPVWDYKSSGFTVYLISEDPWKGIEEEYVTISEMKKYIVSVGIPYEKARFKTEYTRKNLNVWRLSPELTVNFKEND
tara:strand:+ start:5063 stop:5362 length:300 start_codon:yes stop_codon:yes gene_type:complete